MVKLTKKFIVQIPPTFNSKKLKIGEMMEVYDTSIPGQILLKTYDGIVSLNDPNQTWSSGTMLSGRKLLPGEEILLTQE